MGVALQKLSPKKIRRSRVRTDEETLQTLIAGMGELHLDIIVDRMKREFKVEANVGKPQVSYKESLKKPAEAEGKFVASRVAAANTAPLAPRRRRSAARATSSWTR